jgi:hypothetical protein
MNLENNSGLNVEEPQENIDAELAQIMEKIGKLKDTMPDTASYNQLEVEGPEELEIETVNEEDLNEESPDKQEEENIQEVKEPSRSPKKILTRRDLIRDKYRAWEEKKAIEQENQRLRQQIEESRNYEMYYYAKNAEAELEKAKLDFKKAYEEGDLEAVTEANIKINQALQRKTMAESWRPLPSPQEENVEPQIPVDYALREEIANDWIENHEYLRQTSKNYNPELSQKVISFANQLDEAYKRKGREDLIMSEDYLNTLENYVGNLKKQLSQKINPISKPAPIKAMAPVGSVRNYGKSKSLSIDNITLDENEKFMAQMTGTPERIAKKYKLQSLNKMQKSR